jgi:hypothetical protein
MYSIHFLAIRLLPLAHREQAQLLVLMISGAGLSWFLQDELSTWR